MYSGTWLGKYVAIVEPPVVKGKASVKQVKRTGRKLLSSSQAAAAARRWIEEHRFAEMPKYGLLARKNVEQLTPLLVREEPPVPPLDQRGRTRQLSRASVVPHYYIVPFGIRGETDRCGTPLARICVLVNAYTGAFEEITTFGKALKHLTEREARSIAANALGSASSQLRGAEVTLMFQAGDITHVRTYPFWRVRLGNRTLYVDQLGTVYGKLLPAIPGD